MEFETYSIEILLCSALAKAKTSRTNQGFRDLEEAIEKWSTSNKSKTKNGPRISQKYINENIHKQLIEARKNRQDKVGLKEEHVNRIIEYIGYKDTTDFTKNLERIRKKIQWFLPDEISQEESITVIRDKNDAERLEGLCTECLCKNQPNPYFFVGDVIDEGVITAIKHYLNKPAYLVLLVSSDLIEIYPGLPNKIDKLSKNNEKIIPVWADTEFDETYLYHEWLKIEDLKILIQCILYPKEESIEGNDHPIGSVPNHVKIKKAGKVHFGNQNIHAENYSEKRIIVKKKGGDTSHS